MEQHHAIWSIAYLNQRKNWIPGEKLTLDGIDDVDLERAKRWWDTVPSLSTHTVDDVKEYQKQGYLEDRPFGVYSTYGYEKTPKY